MKEKSTKRSLDLFGKSNYTWMIIGAVLIIGGMLLMAGGKSADPNVFNENEVYSFRRITLAPLLIVAGFIVEIYALFKKA
ncbi:MAG: hypothetical protein RL423_588 [Bacteroidota bacterium]|jgi:hypothetical protein